MAENAKELTEKELAELTPMMQHYLQTKEQHPGCILFYRLGDFYEMFFEDAVTVSRELEITLIRVIPHGTGIIDHEIRLFRIRFGKTCTS